MSHTVHAKSGPSKHALGLADHIITALRASNPSMAIPRSTLAQLIDDRFDVSKLIHALSDCASLLYDLPTEGEAMDAVAAKKSEAMAQRLLIVLAGVSGSSK